MERVTFEEYEAAKAAVLYGKEYEETSSMENNVIHKQYVCKDGRYEICSGRRIRHSAGSNTYPDRRGSGSRRGGKRQNTLTLSKAVKAGCKVIALERTDTVAGMTTDDIAALKGVLKQYE